MQDGHGIRASVRFRMNDASEVDVYSNLAPDVGEELARLLHEDLHAMNAEWRR